MILSLLLILPILTVVLILLCRKPTGVKYISLASASVQLLMVFYMLFQFMAERNAGNNSPFLFFQNYNWFPSWHIQFSTGIDGISAVMILLTSLVVLAGVLISWNMKNLEKEFFTMLVLLSAGAYGFFISLDLFTLFFFLEVAVIPKFLLIGIWGSGRKEASAMKLALMLMGGSALILVGMILLYYVPQPAGISPTFNLLDFAAHVPDAETQKQIFPFLFAGFGVFTAMFPFHTWAPDGHSSAPTAASMFLAGISMKLGGYGCLRVAVWLLPDAAHYYAPIIIIVSTIAIIYGAFATLMQTDLKYINAYSSVSHCGFVLLGIGMLTKTSITGAVFQMVSHGLMTALFFGAIGIMYERTHTRELKKLNGLLKIMPFTGVVFVISGLCSLGLPGLSGFAAEMTVFMGSWENQELLNRVATILACASIVVTAVYILRATGKAWMGTIIHPEYNTLTDAAWYEKSASILLILAIVFLGMAPFWLIHLVDPDTAIIFQQLNLVN